MSEDELPSEIDKLIIAPTQPQVVCGHTDVPLSLNPFYDDHIKLSATNAEAKQKQSAQFSKCRRSRWYRRTESADLHDFNANAACNAGIVADVATSIPRHDSTHGVQHKQPLKRTVICSSGGRQIFMREPMLRALKTCFCANSTLRRKLATASCESAVAETGGINDVQQQFPARGMTDFRSLIDECQTLLQQDVEVNKQRAMQRNSKQFKCLRGPSTAKLSLEQQSTLARHATDSEKTEALTVNNNSISSGWELSVSSARARTTCSQQAGNSNVPCDDVTIDELASYFDTFVHIPKKMSKMAEMMYI